MEANIGKQRLLNSDDTKSFIKSSQGKTIDQFILQHKLKQIKDENTTLGSILDVFFNTKK